MSKVKTGGVTPSLVLGTGGGNCYGQTDAPHASGHVPGTVNVVGRTVCPTTDYVLIDLYRQHWYGWEYMSSGQKTNYGTAQSNAATTCTLGTNFLYEGDGYHEATGAGEASTYNNADLTCP